MIYFLRSGALIKIGHTGNLPQRLPVLRWELPSPRDSEMLLIGDGGRPEEKMLHAKFRPLKAFSEWHYFGRTLFSHIAGAPNALTDEVADYLRRYLSAGFGPGWTVQEKIDLKRSCGVRQYQFDQRPTRPHPSC